MLHEARLQSQTPTVPQLVTRSGSAEEEVEQLLETMSAPGWARRVEPSGWVLARDLQTLQLVEVYRLLGVRSYEAQVTDGELVRAAAGLLTQVERELEVPLGALASAKDPATGAEPSLSQPAPA